MKRFEMRYGELTVRLVVLAITVVAFLAAAGAPIDWN